MKQTTIDSSLLPDVWLFWETTKGIYYLECKTGKKQQERPNLNNVAMYMNCRTDAILLRSGSTIRFAYTKHHDDIKMLEIAVVEMPSTRNQEIHNWRYAGKKYFINANKDVYDEYGNICTKETLFDAFKYHQAYGFKYYLSMVSRCAYRTAYGIKEFHKLIGNHYYTISTGKTIEAEYFWHIQDWYAKKAFVRKEKVGREQKLVDKLTSIPLKDCTNEFHKYPAKEVNRWERINHIMYYERINEEWSVLRMFRRYGKNESETFEEVERMYLSDKGANRITAKTETGWFPAKQTHTYNVYYQFVNQDEAMAKCPRIKYIAPLFEGESRDIRDYLVSVLRFPEIEQIMKFGYTDYGKNVAKSSTPKAFLKNTFGGYYNDKEKNILRKVGLTKAQFDFYMRSVPERRYYSSSNETALVKMREFFGNDLSHIDFDTFTKYFNAFRRIANVAYNFYSNVESLNLDYKAFIKNTVRLYEKYEHTITLLNDTMRISRMLDAGTVPEINWLFDTISDLNRVHNALDALQRAQQAERMAFYRMEQSERQKKLEEKRIKIDEGRKSFEYEDDNYIIRLPKDGTEITNEGLMQGICIGGYVESHSQGNTNLFFIREKSAPNVPFYAIEMNRNKSIVQIHGRHNRWLGNNPEVIPTVIRWLRKNGIQCSNEILTCKATGYGRTAEYVPMPVVD